MTKVAILGYGVVGSGLVELIDKNREVNSNSKEIEITGILVRNYDKHKNDYHSNIITTDIDTIFNRESDVIIELIGGTDNAYEFVKRGLREGKHVITANKDLIAEYGEELFDIAQKSNVSLKFEASVGGGIPIIKTITESLVGDEVREIKTIINGTTNFILSKMYNDNSDYEGTLREAQELGFAEANPEADVMGYDAGRKLAILINLCFNKNLYWKDINIEGITSITNADIRYAKKLNSKIKLVGHAIKKEEGIYATVRPVLVKNNNILATIDNEFNIVEINSNSLGEGYYIGKGAGKLPTANSVYTDLIDIIENRGVRVTGFGEDLLTVESKIQEQCTALIKLSTDDITKALEVVDKNLNVLTKISDDIEDELAILVEANKELEIDETINELINNGIVYSGKKIMCI